MQSEWAENVINQRIWKIKIARVNHNGYDSNNGLMKVFNAPNKFLGRHVSFETSF